MWLYFISGKKSKIYLRKFQETCYFLISELEKGMAYKQLSRKDYQRLIAIANEKKKPKARRRRKSDQRGGITVPDLLLAKMISNDNRNQVQGDAVIDTMNNSLV